MGKRGMPPLSFEKVFIQNLWPQERS